VTIVAACLAAAVLFALPGRASADIDAGAQLPGNVALAETFMAALNAHDVDAIVGLFSEDGPGATVHADRYAWTAYEIRLWAQKQVDENVQADGYAYEAFDHGAVWAATLYRDDFQAAGVDAVALHNTIFVEDGKIADFTATLVNARDRAQLGDLWRPGSAPDYRQR